ncbi:MAG: biopolymer transporter ExbD [Phycisphaerae bacterium]|nr:biopolymer transporter ExbD [Phycisphaerae bacterium]
MRTFRYTRLFEAETFDMTPIIDVVFLLIIFFMLVAQFIVAEQYKVSVPDAIKTARAPDAEKDRPLTITLMPDPKQGFKCIMGAEKLAVVDGKDMKMLIVSSINDYLAKNKSADKTVRLRCDRAVPFGQVKYILAGISQSRAENLDWAVLSD